MSKAATGQSEPRAPSLWPEFEGEALVQVRVRATPDRLRVVRGVVAETAGLAGCSAICVRDMVIAVDEACQNVIRHAYREDSSGVIVLDIRRVGDRIAFNLVDFAAPVDVSTIAPRDLNELRPGGLGTHFIAQCMDEVEYVTPPPGAGNRLRMSKRIE